MQIGNVVEYKNDDDEYKLAVIVEILPLSCMVITFKGKIRTIQVEQILAETLEDYIQDLKNKY